MSMLPKSISSIGGIRFASGLLVAAAGVLISSQVLTQTGDDAVVAQVRASIVQRALWGRDFPLMVASIPGWNRIGEGTIVVAPDVIFGATPHLNREEAEKQTTALATALSDAAVRFRPEFAQIAEQGKTAAAAKVSVRRYGNDESHRVVVGPGLDLLPPDLRISDVQRVLGKEQAVKRETEEGGGERRPLFLTSYVYAGGAVVYQTSNYTAAPDQVFRVVLNVPSALRAIAEEQR
jgi:hypothetical protein